MKKLMVILFIAVLALTMLACGRQVEEVPQDQDPNNNGNGTVVDPNPADEEKEVTLYFMNQEYIETGNEEVEKVIEVKREVTVGEQSLEEAVMAELQKKPEEGMYTSLENIKILSVETVENTAYVNISSDGLYGGSLEEISLMNQVVLTLTDLPDIKAVQFLVDGSKRETLMGHFLIEEPITREDIGF
ncbi:GerMN domain-containing protein [Alkaliphilus serpentinus]|uniref:GerMN domain-containing protein n=1 Tax=Alkaliphilus serpentinus TaxID=1482731 RepID=A0A833HLT3_9FIRM|nr:GerMN domain-containing protein [Alkaliphilus serpentinus]KAB3526656.1 GerMN domain-containing protein [Alkaliphilus serpentinus]